MNITLEMILLALPLVLIELGVKIYAIVDVLKPGRNTKGLSKQAWIVVLAVISFSWILYFMIGREDGDIET